MSNRDLSRQAEQLRALAAAIAGPLAARARTSTTPAQERALLRIFGVDGLDRTGRPLAAVVVERYCGADPERLAGGVSMPFAAAVLEYDMSPRELALEVASGAVDLALEAETLARPERLTAANALVGSLVAAARARFEENRTAAGELRTVIADAPAPWLGVTLEAGQTQAARSEAKRAVAAGADVIRVRVPANWELTQANRATAGYDLADERNTGRGHVEPGGAGGRGRGAPVPFALPVVEGLRDGSAPAGSQRGLTILRHAADEAAAERGFYVSLMTVTSAFAAPEQAVVAAFERIDLVEADPLREIVEDNIDPERALADHAFAHRLDALSGCRVVVGPGPLALAREVERGIPSSTTARAGSALALQALGVELALADGIPADRLMLGAVPGWLSFEADPSGVVAQAWLRRLVFPNHPLVIEDPTSESTLARCSFPLAAALFASNGAAIVLGGSRPGGTPAAARELRDAAASSGALSASLAVGPLHGHAAQVVAETVAAAKTALQLFDAEGWDALVGTRGSSQAGGLGWNAVAPRASRSDPLEAR